ncbi:MAG: DUF4870 domain-containing protein [Phycisphaerales bacterium]|nr:MAG: DUF4870 domain-containing protein [Phycisphaerales bacterium]
MAETNETPAPTEVPAGGKPPQEQPRAEEREATDQPESSKDARNMAMLCHLLGAVGFFGPLVIWLNEKDKHRFVDEHGRAAMDYQVSILIYYVVSWLLCFVVVGVFLLLGLTLLHIIFVIIAALRASRGRTWRYPIAIPFLK